MIRRNCPSCQGRGYHLARLCNPVEFILGYLGHATDPTAWEKCRDCNGKGWYWVEWRDLPRRHR